METSFWVVKKSDGHLPLLFRVPAPICHGLHLNEGPLSDRQAILEAAGGDDQFILFRHYTAPPHAKILIYYCQSRIVFVVQFYLIWYFVSIFRELSFSI